MHELKRLVLVPAAMALILAGCGGGASSAPTGTPTGNATEPPTSSQGPTDAAPTDAAATPGETTGGGGGGGSSAACDLVTAEEVGSVMGQSGVTITMNTPGGVSYCIYSGSTGDAVAATTLMQQGAAAAFAIWKSGAGVQQIDGLGDDAVFDPASATLLVLKGDALFSVTAGDGTEDEAQRIDWSKALAEKALGRM